MDGTTDDRRGLFWALDPHHPSPTGFILRLLNIMQVSEANMELKVKDTHIEACDNIFISLSIDGVYLLYIGSDCCVAPNHSTE